MSKFGHWFWFVVLIVLAAFVVLVSGAAAYSNWVSDRTDAVIVIVVGVIQFAVLCVCINDHLKDGPL